MVTGYSVENLDHWTISDMFICYWRINFIGETLLDYNTVFIVNISGMELHTLFYGTNIIGILYFFSAIILDRLVFKEPK